MRLDQHFAKESKNRRVGAGTRPGYHRRPVRASPGHASLCLAALLLGCDPGGAAGIGWFVRPGRGVDTSRVASVEARILQGGCSGPTIYIGSATLAPGARIRRPEALDPGVYGFEASYGDAACQWFARGCVTRTLPDDSGEDVIVVVEEIPPEAACPPERCGGGACDADAGPGGGADAGRPRDAGPPPPTCETAFTDVSAGGTHACALATGGAVYCFGGNARGQLGLGDTAARATPTLVEGGVRAVSAGWDHTLVIRADRTLAGWGGNGGGQLGQDPRVAGQMMYSSALVVDADPPGFDVASAGRDVSCVVTSAAGADMTQLLACGGLNDNGQLGIDRTETGTFALFVVQSSERWKHVTSGGQTGCGIRVSGQLHCWGRADAQLGLGRTDGAAVRAPLQVGTASDWARVEVSGTHACGLRDDGSLHCWGQNADGQLGLGDTAPRTRPERVGADTDWEEVDVGDGHTCARKRDGSLHCWGSNARGELGRAGGGATVPERVGAAAGWTAVSTGGDHTCGVRGGALLCWGAFDGAAGAPTPTALCP